MGWGGQEIRVFQETQLLLEKGCRVDIVCRKNSPLAKRCESLSDPGFHYFSRAMDKAFNPSALAGVYRLLKKLKPDIVHTHSSIDSWQFSIAARLLGIPVVRSRHVSLPIRDFFPNNWLYSKAPDHIITSGEAISDLVRRVKGVRPENVSSVSAGVDLKRFDFHLSGGCVRQELGLQAGQPLIGKVGVIRGWKGHDHFLEAIPLIQKQIPNARFVMAGDGPGFDEIKRKTESRGLGAVATMLGHREDVPEIMAACEVLVLASTSGEGTPQVIPQAFAMKTPMVASRIGSTESLLGDGERGILVAPGKADEIAEGVCRLIAQPGLAEELAAKAYQYCLRELTAEKMILDTLQVYNKVLDSRSALP